MFRFNSGLYSAGCAMRVVTLSGDCNHSRRAAIVWLLGISFGGGVLFLEGRRPVRSAAHFAPMCSNKRKKYAEQMCEVYKHSNHCQHLRTAKSR
jgi:hypothetical protein